MRSQPFEAPQLFVEKAGELPLSGQVLLELMRAVLARGKSFRFCARGWSMAPFIMDGDVITVAPLQGKLPGIGDVIAFVRPAEGTLVVHRAVARQGAAVLIQGDGVASQSDGLVPLENLLGLVVSIERKGRRIRLGIGPERYVIAWLSRAGLLIPFRMQLAYWRKRLS